MSFGSQTRFRNLSSVNLFLPFLVKRITFFRLGDRQICILRGRNNSSNLRDAVARGDNDLSVLIAFEVQSLLKNIVRVQCSVRELALLNGLRQEMVNA